MAWNLSTPDWQNRVRTGQSLIPDLPLLDKVAAERAVNVFDKLRLPDVPGKPLLKDAAGDWFRAIVRALHGSIVNGERMVREPFLLVPKKSSKTSYGAALMLTSLLINERPKAEFLLIAPTQPIAEIAFNQVEGMIAAEGPGNQGCSRYPGGHRRASGCSMQSGRSPRGGHGATT